ncbi:MAG: TolB family protein [Gaiellaceae bacterium]
MKRRAVAVLALTLAAAGLVAVALSSTGSVVAPRPAPWATLAFTRADAAGGGVYLADGRKVLRLRRVAGDPAWSPDGRRLAFVAPGAGGAGDVFVVDADGDHKGRLTRTDRIDEASPSWSPDGRHLVVERGGKLVVLRAEGDGGRRLATGLEPAWSPAGRRIAFTDGDNLYLISARAARRSR